MDFQQLARELARLDQSVNRDTHWTRLAFDRCGTTVSYLVMIEKLPWVQGCENSNVLIHGANLHELVSAAIDRYLGSVT